MEKDDLKDYSKSIECSYCGTEYTKTNKPLVMKCSHNLCQTCHSLNKGSIKCLICGVKYEAKENKRHPINFLLLEIIERNQTGASEKKEKKKKKKGLKDSQTEDALEGPSEVFRCVECNVILPNKNHISPRHYPTHTLQEEVTKEPPEEKVALIKGLDVLMNKYQNYNETLKNYNETFFNYLGETFQKKSEDIRKELEGNDQLDNFMIFGIINKSDKERIKEFTEKYLSNLNIVNILNESKSFDELLIKLSEFKDIKIHLFLSSYFYYEEILNKKLNLQNIETKITKFKEDISNHSDNPKVKSLFQLFAQDVHVHVYNGLNLEQDINKNIKLPFILTKKNNLIVFDTLTESIKSFAKINQLFPVEFSSLQDFSYYVTSSYQLLITGGKLGDHLAVGNCFSINLNTNEVKHYGNMSENRYGHSSVVANNKLFVLGGRNTDSSSNLRTFEKLNLADGSWVRIQNCPHELKNKPNLLNFEDQYVYIFDDLSHFFYYEIKHDKWTVCKPSYRGSYYLGLKNFTTMVHNSNVIILGGVDCLNNVEEVNRNIYFLKDVGSLISAKGEFGLTDNSSKVDHGFVVDNHYILEFCENKGILKVFHSKDLSTYKWNLISLKENQDLD